MAVYDARLYTETVSAVTATPSVDVGLERRVGDECYVYVYNAGNSEIPPSYGAVCSAVSGYSVTISSTTSVDLCMGVVKHTTLTTGTYGWLMVRGFAQVELGANNSAAAGQLLALAGDGTFALKSLSTGYATPALGKTMEAITSGASGTAYIRVW